MFERLRAVALPLFCLLVGFRPAYAKELAPGAKEYELSEVIRAVLVDRPKPDEGLATTAFRDYNFFKKYVRDIQFHSETWCTPAAAAPCDSKGSETMRGNPKVYIGKLGLLINGKRSIAENPEDKYDWTAYVGGPMVGATDFELASEKPGGVGADYFRAAGFSLYPVACHNPGGAAGNYDAAYIIVAPGKIQAILTIRASTGSGGSWYQYGLHLSGMNWLDTPGFTRNKQDPLYPMGDCRIAGKP